MKVISKEEEKEHYGVVIHGGLIGGSVGLAVGFAGVLGASRRYPAFRQLTLPFRSFLVTSAGTFGAIIIAERYSVQYQRSRDEMNQYMQASHRAVEEARRRQRTDIERFTEWGRENRYTIVLAGWAAAMGIALAIVGRNKYMTASQKLVEARVYAQGLTLALLIATAAFETADAKSGKGRWETVMVVDPDDPTHQHMIEKRIHKEDYEGQDLWKGMSPPYLAVIQLGRRRETDFSFSSFRDGRRRGEAHGREEEARGHTRLINHPATITACLHGLSILHKITNLASLSSFRFSRHWAASINFGFSRQVE
jgi:hypothetical protein